jgi:hypothetical protein
MGASNSHERVTGDHTCEGLIVEHARQEEGSVGHHGLERQCHLAVRGAERHDRTSGFGYE